MRVIIRNYNSGFIKQVVRYILAGALSNLLVLGAYYIFTFGSGIIPTTALGISSGIGFVVSYTIQRLWTFQKKVMNASSILRYLTGYVASFTIQWIILFIGASKLGLPHQWVVLFGLCVATVGFFSLQRYWIFAAAEEGTSRE